MPAANIQSGLTASPEGGGTAVKLAYSLGNLGKSIVATSFDIFLLYYLVRIAGVTPFAAGGLLMAVMLWDGCADIALAYLADRDGRANVLGRLVLLGAPLCGVSFWLIFAIPPTDWWYTAILAAAVSCRVGYTLCDIGHNTLLVRIATTARAAATVSGMRLIFSAMGAGLVGLAAAIVLPPGPWHRQTSFATVAMIGGVIYVGTLLIAIRATRHLPFAVTGMTPSSGRASFGSLWRNRHYRIVLCLIALQAGVMPLFNRALPFVGEATHGNAGWAGTALTIITLSQAFSLPAWMTLARWRSPNAILILAYGAMMIALGAAPLGGPIGLAGLSLIGIAQAGMSMAIWALLALSVRQGAADGSRQEALPVGLFLAVLKGSAGIGGGVLATAVGAGNRWCSACGGHESLPILLAATILPISGCVAGLFIVLWSRRARDCQDLRVWAGIMGKTEIPYVPTQRACDTE